MQDTTPPHIEPYTLTVLDAVGFSGCSRTRLFEAIRDGTLNSRQAGRRTLIFADSLRAWIDGLPPATERTRTIRKTGA